MEMSYIVSLHSLINSGKYKEKKKSLDTVQQQKMIQNQTGDLYAEHRQIINFVTNKT